MERANEEGEDEVMTSARFYVDVEATTVFEDELATITNSDLKKHLGGISRADLHRVFAEAKEMMKVKGVRASRSGQAGRRPGAGRQLARPPRRLLADQRPADERRRPGPTAQQEELVALPTSGCLPIMEHY